MTDDIPEPSAERADQARRAVRATADSVIIAVVAVATWLMNMGDVSLAACLIWAVVLNPTYDWLHYALIVRRERKQAKV